MNLRKHHLIAADVDGVVCMCHVLNAQGKQITVEPFNNDTGRWLKPRQIPRTGFIKQVFATDGKPQSIQRHTRMAA